MIINHEREDLARAIHKAGTTEPDSLAAYLIREGWGKRQEAFTGGVVSAISAVNGIREPMMRPMMRGMLS